MKAMSTRAEALLFHRELQFLRATGHKRTSRDHRYTGERTRKLIQARRLVRRDY